MTKKGIILVLCLMIFSAFFMSSSLLAENNAGDRHIVFFQATKYNSKLANSIDYIFNDLVKPEDQLTIFTPVKPYGFSQKTRKSQTKGKLIKLTKDVLKRDIAIGSASYQNVLNNMAQVSLDIGNDMGISSSGNSSGFSVSLSTVKRNLVNYRQLLEEMRNLRKLNEDLFIKLSGMLKKSKAKAYFYIIYQKEYRVIPDRKVMDALMKNENIRFDVVEVFQQENVEEFINVEKVSKALKKSNIMLHFFYINTNEKRKRGTEYKEFSGDVYSIFSKISKNTGGKVVTTTKPKSAFKEINTK